MKTIVATSEVQRETSVTFVVPEGFPQTVEGEWTFSVEPSSFFSDAGLPEKAAVAFLVLPAFLRDRGFNLFPSQTLNNGVPVPNPYSEKLTPTRQAIH